MGDKMITAVRNWITHIMPDVASTIVTVITPELIEEISKEKAVHGPYSIDIEELRGPITSINFYVMTALETMLVAVTADIKDAGEDYTPNLTFDMYFKIADFPSKITDDEHVQQLVDLVMEQYTNVR